MSSPNPYEPPAIPAELLEPQWPSEGVYRDGHYLVLHHTTRLPAICVKTGQPAETEQTYELAGGLPNDNSVPATKKRWYGDKVYAIALPLSQRAVTRAARYQVAGLILAGTMLCGVVTVGLMPLSAPSYLREGGLIVVVLGLISSVAMLTEARLQLQLECIARGYFWISKAPRAYLKQLPEWPVPRPSFWRRAFFGPAGVSPGNSKTARTPADATPDT